MIQSIIFLCAEQFASQLKVLYKGINPQLSTITINSTKELYAIPRAVLKKSRLISFLSTVIVPSEVLGLIKHGAYNFHPAPPSRPGWGAHNFAIYQQDDYFGTTLHKMIEYVDAGPIVAIDTFLIPKGCKVDQLSNLVRDSLSRLVNQSAKDLITIEQNLPVLPFAWGATKYTKKDFIDITYFNPDIKRSELDRLIKAFGEKGNIAHLRFVLNDEIYFYEPEPQESDIDSQVRMHLHGHLFIQRSIDSIHTLA
jgi:methionyl-tRNA formyltransferase